MTDPMDDLRQSSAEVSGVKVLSPAALAIWDAFSNIVEDHGPPRLALAAALRALCRTSTDEAMVRGWVCKVLTTEDILAIAAELEGGNG